RPGLLSDVGIRGWHCGRRRGIKVHDEDLEAELLLKAGGEILCLGNRRCPANEYSPEDGITDASDELGGSIFFGKLRPQVFGILMDSVGTDLHTVEVAHCQRSVWRGSQLALDDIGIG